MAKDDKELTSQEESKEVAEQKEDLFYGLTEAEVDVVKDTVAKGASDEELKLFLYTAHQKKLDPMSGQIYFVKRGKSMTIQTGIDGYRAIAERSGHLIEIGQPVHEKAEDPEAGIDHPIKSTVTVKRTRDNTDKPVEVTASARWNEYKKEYKNGLARMWKKMPYLMLGKCAEALALRKAFPQDLSGLYTSAEMSQADGEAVHRALPSEHKNKKKKKRQERKKKLVKKKKEIMKLMKQLCELTDVNAPDSKAGWIEMIKIVTNKEPKEGNLDDIIGLITKRIKKKQDQQNEKEDTIDGEVVEDKEYPCEYCEKGYDNESVLDMHVRKEHSEQNEEKESEKTEPEEQEDDDEPEKQTEDEQEKENEAEQMAQEAKEKAAALMQLEKEDMREIDYVDIIDFLEENEDDKEVEEFAKEAIKNNHELTQKQRDKITDKFINN